MSSLYVVSAFGALLCLAVGLALASRRGAPADRHQILFGAAACALLMPLIVAVVPGQLPRAAAFAPHAAMAEAVTRPSGPMPSGPTAVDARPSSVASRAAMALPTASQLLVAVWALGTILCLLRLARAHRRAAAIAAQAEPAARGFRYSDAIDVPMVVGVARPVILVPDAARAWPRDAFELALLHERTHVERHDVAKQWVASLACALHWYNPLAWIVARRMAREREHAVDAAVLARGVRASSYAALLVRAASRDVAPSLFTPLHEAAASKSDLATRIEAIFAAHAPQSSRARQVTATLFVAGVATVVACAQPRAVTTTAAPLAPHHDGEHVSSSAGGEASSLDPARQRAAEAMLAGWVASDAELKTALVVALEARTGRVVAMAAHGRARGPWSGADLVYPPGSTLKPIVVAAAIDAGVLRATDRIDTGGGTRSYEGGRTVTDVTPRGVLTVGEVLALSSNVGATKIADRLGPGGVLGAYDGVDLFGEIPGVAQGTRPAAGDAYHWATVTLGHDVTVAPLRLAAAYAAVATGDRVVPALHPVDLRSPHPTYRAETAASVTTLLEAVVSEEGTAPAARVSGLRVAGKTGTTSLEDGAVYASFVGIVPADAPRYIVLVGAERASGSGGAVAAPRFAQLVDAAFR